MERSELQRAINEIVEEMQNKVHQFAESHEDDNPAWMPEIMRNFDAKIEEFLGFLRD